MWGTVKRKNTHVIGVPEEEEIQNSTEAISEETMTKNFPKLKKDIELQIQENIASSRKSTKNVISWHFIVESPKKSKKKRQS